MNVREALVLYLRYGSRLDAYAAQAAARLIPYLPPDLAEVMERTRADEARHARGQADLARDLLPELDLPNGIYAKVYAGMCVTPDPLWNAVWLHVGERMFALQFRVIARRARALGYREVAHGLMEIAHDEDIHVQRGAENIRSLCARRRAELPALYRQVAMVMDATNAADPLVQHEIPVALGLPPLSNLSSRVAEALEISVRRTLGVSAPEDLADLPATGGGDVVVDAA